MIQRTLEDHFREALSHYPVIVVTGPRQSGKTTLCRATLPDKPYADLEPLDRQSFARDDPRGFLAQFSDGAILDEVQFVPELLGYLKESVDEDATPGRWVLTGSQHFGLTEAISQSLAGRASILYLLPPAYDELQRFDDGPTELMETLWAGAYPRIWHRNIPAGDWLRNYVTTYVQRDVRQVLDVGDLETFTTFLRLAAGRTAQEINYSSLGNDVGVSHHTVRSWLSVLETSFVVFRTPPFLANIRKRLVKSPKLHFVDSGLVCHLLRIRTPGELVTHPLRGAVFESWVASEVLKARLHAGREPDLFHYRQSSGAEVDLIVDRGPELVAVAAKSGSTVASGWFDGLKGFREAIDDSSVPRPVVSRVVYGGDDNQTRSSGDAVSWATVQAIPW